MARAPHYCLNRTSTIRRQTWILLLITAELLVTGLLTQPAYAEADNGTYVAKYINSELHKKPVAKWDERIAPQLALASQQRQQADEARRAAEAAEASAQAELAQEQAQAAYVAPTPVVVAHASGTCADWMAQAGVTDTANAYRLIMGESGCNPNSVNPYSGACGLGQQLPCGKWSHTWNDPVGGMIDMQAYVYAVYGSWANAWAKWQSRSPHWY